MLTLSFVGIVHRDDVFTISLRESKICPGVIVTFRPRDRESRIACTPDYLPSITLAADRAAAVLVYRKASNNSLRFLRSCPEGLPMSVDCAQS